MLSKLILISNRLIFTLNKLILISNKLILINLFEININLDPHFSLVSPLFIGLIYLTNNFISKGLLKGFYNKIVLLSIVNN